MRNHTKRNSNLRYWRTFEADVGDWRTEVFISKAVNIVQNNWLTYHNYFQIFLEFVLVAWFSEDQI